MSILEYRLVQAGHGTKQKYIAAHFGISMAYMTYGIQRLRMPAVITFGTLARRDMYQRDRFTLPLSIILISGVAGVGIDLDHMLVLFWRGEAFTLENLATKAGRPLHWPGVIVGGVVFVIVVSRHFRLLAKLERDERH